MNEEIETLKDVVRRLQGIGVDYMVTGSFAMTLHAMPRMTRDIDIVIAVAPETGNKLLKAFQEGYYISESAVRDAIQNERMFNIISDQSVVKVDLIIKKKTPWSDNAFSRRKNIVIDGMPISVATREDLIVAKLMWIARTGSEMQEKDIRNLLSADCDMAYVRSQIHQTEITNALERILGNG